MAKKKPSSFISSPDENPTAPARTVVTAPEVQARATVFHHSGPLPDPRTLEYYERVYPGTAREIIEMAKIEQTQRHRDASGDRTAHILGQIFAFTLAMTGLCGGILLLYSGKDVTGFGVFVVSLGTLIAASIWQKAQKSDFIAPLSKRATANDPTITTS